MIDIQERLRQIGPLDGAPDDDLLVCRCEEITKGEIRRAIHQGMFTIEELRRYLRCGMGLCQGQTCGRLVKNIVAAELGVSPTEITSATARAPMRRHRRMRGGLLPGKTGDLPRHRTGSGKKHRKRRFIKERRRRTPVRARHTGTPLRDVRHPPSVARTLRRAGRGCGLRTERKPAPGQDARAS